MDILIGLLIIAIGSFCQSSSYVPIKKVKEWSWESFWLVQGARHLTNKFSIQSKLHIIKSDLIFQGKQ